MDLSIFLSVVAGLMHIVAFIIYNKQILNRSSQPNLVTWTLWVFLTVLNVSSYFVMSGDWIKIILPTSSSVVCILTFLFALFKGKFSKLDFWDSVALFIGMISVFAWWYFKSATYANIILQVSIAISFVPTYRGVWKDPNKERPLPWYLWSFAYILGTIVIIMRWQNQYQDLAYPISCFILHGVVGVLLIRKNK